MVLKFIYFLFPFLRRSQEIIVEEQQEDYIDDYIDWEVYEKKFDPQEYEFDYFADIYNNTPVEEKKLEKTLTKYFYELGIAKIIMKYKGNSNCEFCKQPYEKEWIRLPCDHYIHKYCFEKINRHCPKCNTLI